MDYEEELDLQGGDRGAFFRQNFSALGQLENAFSHNHLGSLSSPMTGPGGYYSSYRNRQMLQPSYSSLVNQLPPYAMTSNPSDGICTHYLKRAAIKPKQQITDSVWSADGRWLVFGTVLGDFSLWETESMRVYRTPSSYQKEGRAVNGITKMAWTNVGRELIAGYDHGPLRIFDDTYHIIKQIPNAHNGGVRGLKFCPNDTKFASCGDEKVVKVWDVTTCTADMVFNDHTADTTCLDWHPFRSLILSANKDGIAKLHDPRQNACVSNIMSHRKHIQCCSWNKNGNFFVTGGKDSMLKIFDIRVMREMESLKGHNCDVCSVAWHPIHETLLVSGGYNGSLLYWVMGQQQTAHTAIASAHKMSIDVVNWHPLGHYLVSVSHDGTIKFWSREPPGSLLADGRRELEEVGESSQAIFGYGPLPPSVIPQVISQTSSAVMYSGSGVGGH